MTKDQLLDLGEEQLIKRGLDGIQVDVLLYLDSSDVDSDGSDEGDDLSDADDIGAITTEPTNGNYSRATTTLSAADLSGDWGIQTDSTISFDFSDQSGDQYVDCALLIYNFQAADTNDANAIEHAIANPSLTTFYNIGVEDSIEIPAGDLQGAVS